MRDPHSLQVRHEMFAPRYGHTMTLMAGNHVLVGAGWVDTNDCIRRAERFNPTSDDWIAADTVPGSLGICFHAAARLPNDGFVLVMGGLDAPTGGSALDEAFLYDPIGDDWTSAGTLTDARWRHTATPAGFDDDVLVAGGHATPLASCELFTP